MTNIIRLNESINDYVSRPVITALGEPEIAIRPSIYVAALGINATVEPNQLLIDGNFGQTNPAPFIGVGTGTLSLKSDANGAYLAMHRKGIRTGNVINARNDRGLFVVMKFRLNDVYDSGQRILSTGNGSSGNTNSNIKSFIDLDGSKGFTTYVGGHKKTLDSNVHTVAIYTANNVSNEYLNGKKVTMPTTFTATPNSIFGVGVNTTAFTDTPAQNLDVYNFEVYTDVILTDQQIADYLLTF